MVARRLKDPRSFEYFQYDIAKASQPAIEAYEAVLKMEPAEFMNEAITNWELATRYDPQFYAAYDLMSAAYARQRNLKKAIEAYSPMLNYPPARMPANYQLGLWYAQLGDVKQAREHLEAYRELALKSKSVEVRSDRFQKATKELQKLKE